MKITISKSQWEKIGKEAGWTKTASDFNDNINKLLENVMQQAKKEYPSTMQNMEYVSAIGYLKAIIPDFLNALEIALNEGFKASTYDSAVKSLGAEGIIEKILKLKQENDNLKFELDQKTTPEKGQL